MNKKKVSLLFSLVLLFMSTDVACAKNNLIEVSIGSRILLDSNKIVDSINFPGESICTLGFVGKNNNQTMGLTAGHCASSIKTNKKVLVYKLTPKKLIGEILFSEHAPLDFAVIKFFPWVKTSSKIAKVDINAFISPKKGMKACKISSDNTKQQVCGKITKTNVKIQPSSSLSSEINARTGFILQAKAKQGDSGGPVLISNKIIGILSLAYFADESKKYTYTSLATPIKAIKQKLRSKYNIDVTF